MNLLRRVMAEPELRDRPPVLVDVGAAGGVHSAWQRIARYSIGVGFEPDAREAARLLRARTPFRRWIFCPALAVPAPVPGDHAALHLTRSPQCSSMLRPRGAMLGEWAFAEFFDVMETAMRPALTLTRALADQGIDRIDWLKCDTQGLDLALYRSLPPGLRERLLAVEFEPGLIDAYEDEDKLGEVLGAMGREPFWLADLAVGRTPRGRCTTVTERMGRGMGRWFRRLGPTAPAWANARFLRDVEAVPKALDRRAHLLAWIVATISGQHGYALTVAAKGVERFGGTLLMELEHASVRRLRRAMMGNLPGAIWRRLRHG